MPEPILHLWMHMSCRYWLERGRWVHVCEDCKTIARYTKAKAS